MNYYERHVGDYLKDTAHLSLLEHGVYTRLLDVYYTREQAFAPGEAVRLVGARTKDERAAVESVLAEFFIDGRQSRCDREIERFQARVAHNQRVGKLGGRPKKSETQTEPEGNPPGYFREPEPNPPSLQSPEKQKKPPTLRVAPPCPDDVAPKVWADWLALRKAKRAPVTATAIASARTEATKAGLSFEAFLEAWCRRGSQGLEAAWLKPDERPGHAAPSLTVPAVQSPQAAAALHESLRPLTAEERALADVARKTAMARIGIAA